MKRFFVCAMIFIFSACVFAKEPSPLPEAAEKDKIPVWAKDIRRAEIITLGSLPFVTIWTIMGYSLAEKGSLVNPLQGDSSDDFTLDDQKKILGMACSISAVLGVADFAINVTKRIISHGKERRQIEMKNRTLEIIGLDENEEVLEKAPALPDYLKGGLESAVF